MNLKQLFKDDVLRAAHCVDTAHGILCLLWTARLHKGHEQWQQSPVQHNHKYFQLERWAAKPIIDSLLIAVQS